MSSLRRGHANLLCKFSSLSNVHKGRKKCQRAPPLHIYPSPTSLLLLTCGGGGGRTVCVAEKRKRKREREREREGGREGWLRWQEEVVVVEVDRPSVDHLHHRIIGKRLHQSRRIRASSIPSCRGRRGRRRQWCGKDGASRESGRFICVKFASRASRGPRNLERFLRSSLVWMTCTHSTPTS